MRILITALLSAVVILSSSCGKDKDNSKDRKFVSVKLDNRIFLSENPKGLLYAPTFDPSDPTSDYAHMEITGKTKTGDIINFTMAGPGIPLKPGVYPCSQKGNGILMVVNSGDYPASYSSQGSTDCMITITDINNIYVEGTFSGTLKDLNGVAGTRTIQNGAFRAIYTVTTQ
ncbi:hypothetical protein [Chitinophaga qingshengii]|uniref:DUF4402 domain-containing protein n=1 Tax=Chitinophaga qingshengii TaxID=1569794 RepID=A0ABR7TKX4_9BACT|nr:hypothetical protein [Chitinophaga qingshengii]MBC9931147.1 hypothetical protein [Chitinophaga qingshengii]